MASKLELNFPLKVNPTVNLPSKSEDYLDIPFEPHKYHDYILDVMKRRGYNFDSNDLHSRQIYANLLNNLSSDFDYLDTIEKYKGTSYYDTLYNNPYLRGRNAAYSPSGLESLGDTILNIGTLGIAGPDTFSSSSANRYYAGLQSQSNEFLNKTIDEYRQEMTNSAPEQAERLRLAGLNPDLTGGVEPGRASENDQPLSGFSMPDQGGTVLDAASIPFNLVSGIMSLYNSFQGAQSINLQNASQEISNNNNAMNFVLDSLANSFVESNPYKEKPDLSDISTLLDSAGKLDYSGYSRSTRKIINKFFGAFKDNVRNGQMPLGLDKRIAELRNIVTKENWNAANIQSNPLYSDDFRDMVVGIYSTFGNLPNLVEQINLEAAYLEGNYNADYYGTASGTTAAEATNSANELSQSSNEHQKSLMKTMKEIDGIFADVEKKLKDFATSDKRGHIFGLLGLLLLPTLKNQVYNGIQISLPSINLSNRSTNFVKGGFRSSSVQISN